MLQLVENILARVFSTLYLVNFLNLLASLELTWTTFQELQVSPGFCKG